jgi:putative ABC transport system permease protein
MDTFRQDLRYALRRLFKNPGFTTVAILTLALGIGANAAIFSVVHGVLLKRLPYGDPDRLVQVFHSDNGGTHSSMSGPDFFDVTRLSRTLEDGAIIARSRTVLTGNGEPVRLDAAQVSAQFFDVLRVEPLIGRTFRPEENQPGNTQVAVLSYGIWQQRFGGASRVIGQRIMLDGVSTEVVGVMPEGFAFPVGRVLWTPIVYDNALTTESRGAWYLIAIGRARPGVPLDQVSAEVETIGQQLAKQYPDQNEGVRIIAVPLLEATVGDVRRAVLTLLGAVAFVLLIACANVANLLLARAAARGSEMAVRTALGAGRGRLVRQLLTESVLLSVVGGALGLLLAVWGVDVLKSLRPDGIPRLDDVRVDWIVVAFTIAVAVLTGMVFGMVPAWQSTREALSGALKEAGRGALTSRSGARMRHALVIAEMALAVMLLAGAGLLIKSFSRLSAVDPGFEVRSALAFDLSLPDLRYEKPETQVAFFDQLMPRLKSIPGVQSAGAVMALPLSGTSFVLSFQVAGRPPVPPAQRPVMQVRVADVGYFPAVGIPLQRGRWLTDDDRAGSPQVVLLTETAARRFFPNEDPIGKRITLGWGRDDGARAGGEVVGIIGDLKETGLAEADPPQIYVPFRQWPVQGMAVVLKTAVPPESVTASARREVQAVDPNLPIANVRTLEQVVARSISQPRFYMTLLAAFAGVALLLAAIGIFGVLSYAVAQRTREIGIRMALGAQARSLLGLVIRHAMLLAGTGVAAGMIAAWFLSKTMMSTLLFDTDPHDLTTFGLVALTLTMVALIAACVPARRATRVDPIIALRAE